MVAYVDGTVTAAAASAVVAGAWVDGSVRLPVALVVAVLLTPLKAEETAGRVNLSTRRCAFEDDRNATGLFHTALVSTEIVPQPHPRRALTPGHRAPAPLPVPQASLA